MKVYNKFIVAFGMTSAVPEPNVVDSFVVTQQGDIFDSVLGVGNGAAPILDKNLNLPTHAVVIFHLFYSPGNLDTAIPKLEIQVAPIVVAHIGFTVLPQGISVAVDAQNPGIATILIHTDMAGVVNGGVQYDAYSIIGGIS